MHAVKLKKTLKYFNIYSAIPESKYKVCPGSSAICFFPPLLLVAARWDRLG
jgi:hypothetical protein